MYDETSADQAVQEGENATLICRATGHPPPRITWRREDGDPISIRRGHRDMVKVDTYNGSLLHFWKLDRRQMGAFLCIASNDVPPAVSKRIILNVNCEYLSVASIPCSALCNASGPHETCCLEVVATSCNLYANFLNLPDLQSDTFFSLFTLCVPLLATQ
ncbi:hypothetical protein B566_EDAN017589 [Ephemera danica]|nr:hypothetical protein B566_EDAN017589 [Ephemera danica]